MEPVDNLSAERMVTTRIMVCSRMSGIQMIMSSTVVNVDKIIWGGGKFWKLSVSLIKCCIQSHYNGSNNYFFLKSYYSSSTFICSDTFGRCCILQMMQHLVWFGREETEKTALFAFEATLLKVFHASLHCLSPLPPAAGAYPSCRCARATWKDIQPLTLSHTHLRANWSFSIGLTCMFLDYARNMQTPHRKARGPGIEPATYSLTTTPPFAPKKCVILREG